MPCKHLGHWSDAGANGRRFVLVHTFQAISRAVLGMQSVKQGEADFKTFRKIMSDMLADIKRRGEPLETDTTIAAHLLRIRDPASGHHHNPPHTHLLSSAGRS